jgi:hypothetical protein
MTEEKKEKKEKKYVLTESELSSLIEDSLELRALENGGVDNWVWYSESLSDSPYRDEDGKWDTEPFMKEYPTLEEETL